MSNGRSFARDVVLACFLVMCGGTSVGSRMPSAVAAPTQPPLAAANHVVVRFSAPDDSRHAEARCLKGERMIGGGCGCGEQELFDSSPTGFDDNDTASAGWHCTCGADSFVRGVVERPRGAYALCQGIATP